MARFTILLFLLLPFTLVGQDESLPLEYSIRGLYHPGDLREVKSLRIREAWLKRGKVESRTFIADFEIDSLGRSVSGYFENNYGRGYQDIKHVSWEYDVDGYFWKASVNGNAEAIAAKRVIREDYVEDTLFYQSGLVAVFRFYENRRKTEVKYALQFDLLDKPYSSGVIEYNDQGILEKITQDGESRWIQEKNGALILRGKEDEFWEWHLKLNERGWPEELVRFDTYRRKPKATSRTTFTYTWR